MQYRLGGILGVTKRRKVEIWVSNWVRCDRGDQGSAMVSVGRVEV